MEQGGQEECVFIVHSGWGFLHKDLQDGERQIIDFALSGDVIGLTPGNVEAHMAFTSITDVIVFKAHAKTALPAIMRHPQAAEIFCTVVARQNAILMEHLTNLGRRSALVRTAHLLLELWARLQQAGTISGKEYDCPLTQYDLADALGLTAIHVNRMLRELREFGFLSFRKGRVEILDLDGLIAFAQFDGGYLKRDVLG